MLIDINTCKLFVRQSQGAKTHGGWLIIRIATSLWTLTSVCWLDGPSAGPIGYPGGWNTSFVFRLIGSRYRPDSRVEFDMRRQDVTWCNNLGHIIEQAHLLIYLLLQLQYKIKIVGRVSDPVGRNRCFCLDQDPVFEFLLIRIRFWYPDQDPRHKSMQKVVHLNNLKIMIIK